MRPAGRFRLFREGQGVAAVRAEAFLIVSMVIINRFIYKFQNIIPNSIMYRYPFLFFDLTLNRFVLQTVLGSLRVLRVLFKIVP